MVVNIAATITDQIALWVGRRGCLTKGYLVTDGDSNMIAAANHMSHKHIPCMAHFLPLLVKNALDLDSQRNPGML